MTKEKLDVWEATLATDQDKEANMWTKIANNSEEFCQSLLFGICANQYALDALSNKDAAKRMFGPKEVPRIVTPLGSPLSFANKQCIDFGNLEKCEVMIDYISEVEPISVQSKGQGKVRGASGGGNGGPVGPRAPAQHSNGRVVQKAGPVTMVPMSNMVADIVFFTAALGTEFRPSSTRKRWQRQWRVFRLLPEEYQNVKAKSNTKRETSKTRICQERAQGRDDHQVSQHDGKDDEQGEKVEAELIELIEDPREGVKEIPEDDVLRCRSSSSRSPSEYTHLECVHQRDAIKPIYEKWDGDIEREDE